MGLEVASEVFALAGDGYANEHVIITGFSGPAAAGFCCSQARGCFMMVTEDGRVLSDEEAEALDEEMEATGEDGCCTPNYVPGVTSPLVVSGAMWAAGDVTGR